MKEEKEQKSLPQRLKDMLLSKKLTLQDVTAHKLILEAEISSMESVLENDANKPLFEQSIQLFTDSKLNQIARRMDNEKK